jgi:hypothetical protein
MNYLLLKELIQKHISNPRKAIVNSEDSFICEELYKLNEQDLADEYWKLACNMSHHPWPDEIIQLHKQLPKYNLPSWGTYGT